MEATLTSKGQMTLPSEIRKALKLSPGDKLDLDLAADGTVTMRKKSRSLDEVKGLVSIKGAYADMDEWVEEARAALASGVRE